MVRRGSEDEKMNSVRESKIRDDINISLPVFEIRFDPHFDNN